jgi:hypothetical protein
LETYFQGARVIRWIKALYAAASTWIAGWVLTSLSWIIWAFLITGFDALTLQTFHLSNNYQPLLWAGFPAMCTGYGLTIWLVLKSKANNRNVAAARESDKPVLVQPEQATGDRAPRSDDRSSSLAAIGTFVLLTQSICYAPCLMKNESTMFLSEFLLFPLLCAGYAGIAVYRSFGSPSNPENSDEIHPA